MSLTAPERETVITATDEDPVVKIYTIQRKYITALKKKCPEYLHKEGMYGTTSWAEFHLPADKWSPASGVKRTRTMTDEQRRAVGERLAKGRRAR